MAALNDEVKMFITQALACYDSPSLVSTQVYEEFGLTVERGQVQKYDPTKIAGKELSVKLKQIFDQTRKAFLDETIQIPIASRTFRLRSLQRMHDYYVAKRNFVQAQAVLEQAAKEVGNVYTNKQLLGGDKENPFQAFLSQIAGSSLPIAYEVDGEVLENEPPAERVGLWTAKK